MHAVVVCIGAYVVFIYVFMCVVCCHLWLLNVCALELVCVYECVRAWRVVIICMYMCVVCCVVCICVYVIYLYVVMCLCLSQ